MCQSEVGNQIIMRLALLLALVGLCTGCGPTLDQLRWRASHDLDCAEDNIVLTPLDADGDAWGLRGCGKSAAYAVGDSGKDEWVMTKRPEPDPTK